MHPFLRVDFDNSSTVDMINQLSNDTLQDIKVQETESSTTGKRSVNYADSGVDSSNVDLNILMNEIEQELQGSVEKPEKKNEFTPVSHNTKSVDPVYKQYNPHPFMLSDVSFSSSVQQKEYLELSNRKSNERDEIGSCPAPPQCDYSPPNQFLDVAKPASTIKSGSFYSSSSNTSIISTQFPKIKQSLILTGSETVQLEQGMHKLLEQYGIQ
eukprot:NODE_347_length_10448_cov_0.163687.p5 type:complete len:212 gc:universal NODE_347_length_10448_cov_0.163687:1910-2545(+)